MRGSNVLLLLLMIAQYVGSCCRLAWGVSVLQSLSRHLTYAFHITQGECTPATSAAAADHLVRLLKDRAAVIAAEETPHGEHGERLSLCADA